MDGKDPMEQVVVVFTLPGAQVTVTLNRASAESYVRSITEPSHRFQAVNAQGGKEVYIRTDAISAVTIERAP